MAAANAKIPKAQARDNAISARMFRAGSVVWASMCTLSKASTCELILREPNYGMRLLYPTQGFLSSFDRR
jgi:hypothetical protein